MSDQKTSKIWFHLEDKKFFLIPDDLKFLEGDYPIERFDGANKKVNKQPLETHEISNEKVKEMVQESYNDSLKVTKKCLSALSQYRFIIEGKKTTDFEGFEQTNSGDDFYKDIIDSLLDDSISEEERNKNASEMFDKIPNMMSFFSEEKLKDAKKNPELWVKEMENKLFKSQIKKKKDLDKEKLRAEIDEQIKQSLRDAGMDVD